jgi:hypothetical protein
MQEKMYGRPKLFISVLLNFFHQPAQFVTLTLLQSLVFSSFGKIYIIASKKFVLALRNFLNI